MTHPYLNSLLIRKRDAYICPNATRMPLILQGCLAQTCDGLSFSDITGLYNAVDNAGGYGSENGVTGAADLDSYVLRIWDSPDSYYANPSVPVATLDLLESVPSPDSSYHYTWSYTAEELGLTFNDGGSWYWEVLGIKDADEYFAQGNAFFLNALETRINAKMKSWDPTCPCKKGCADVGELYAKFFVLKCFGTCNIAEANDVIAWLNSQLKTCC